MKASTVRALEGGGAISTSRRPTLPELLAQVRQVTEDLPLFLTAPLYRKWHLHWGATAAEGRAPERTAFMGHSYRVNERLLWSRRDSPWVVLMEFGDFAMLRRMLRGIKARAEAGPIRPEEADGG